MDGHDSVQIPLSDAKDSDDQGQLKYCDHEWTKLSKMF